MRSELRGVVLRLGAFTVVCALGTFALITVFAQLRFTPENSYKATFSNVSGLAAGQFVRVAGVEVGKVDSIHVNDDNTATVTFNADDSVPLNDGTRVLIRYDNLVGDRYVELQDGAGGTRPLRPGDTIPLERTQPALDLDGLIGGFRPLFRALDPEQVNALTAQLIQVFQNEGATVNSFLAQTGQLTSALANRDELIGQVIVNLNSVLGTLSAESDKFGEAISSMTQLVDGLAARRSDLSNAVAHSDAAAASVTDLLRRIRPGFANTVAQSDRTSSIVAADYDYLDNLIATLPDTYKILGRQGLYGDFFSYYLCQILLKVNGKGGQPVYVRVANQSTGRCTPK